jgi:hypothetical protein
VTLPRAERVGVKDLGKEKGRRRGREFSGSRDQKLMSLKLHGRATAKLSLENK